ncbi:MAG: phytoene/squalene synthase family protein [Gemmatimonadaceae bacterium]|nr:phytoene/squalene synthase family protein [Gemmatimonadaceae bacterium]
MSMPSQAHEALSDAAYCARVTREHARTFALASRLLPPHKRRAAYALYAFCRVADDLVDRAGSQETEVLRAQLAEYRGQLSLALDGHPSGSIFREISWVSATFGVSPAPLFEVLDGVSQDLHSAGYANWQELAAYCEGVASSVGEMCTYVFGVPAGAVMRGKAIQYARTLGTAMQLTNILRDVGEDAARGRVYLPADELAHFGLSASDVLRQDVAITRTPAWQQFMVFQVNRARALYEAAMPGIALLSPDAQRCAVACATGYAAILTAIEQQQYDTISRRARAGAFTRLGILWNAWRYQAPEADLSVLRQGPRIEEAPFDVTAHRGHVRLA